jgi:hypothetical protein
MGTYLPGAASREGVPLDLVAHPTGYQLGQTAQVIQEIVERANRLGWSEAQVIGHMQRRCRWPASVKQLSTLPEDWQRECVSALDRVIWPHEVAAEIARIDHRLQRLNWTIADAVEYCCVEGLWDSVDSIVTYTRQTQREERLTLEQLGEMAEALAGKIDRG